MKKRSFISIILLLTFLSCKKDEIAISAMAESYLNEVLDIMQANSVNKNSINWTDFRNEVFKRAGAPQSIEQTYQGIKRALVLLGDHHSFYVKSNGTVLFGDNLSCAAYAIATPALPNNIGYVKVDWFSGTISSDEALAYVQALKDSIINQDQADLLGWIIDLRANIGGNMWPMIAGIGPILGEGTAGYFVYPDNSNAKWGFSEGSPFLNTNVLNTLVNDYELINPNPKVAVLTDDGVSSSGEALAIGFIGRENTKSFGVATCGLSTSNVGFALSDNGTLVLTVSTMADRGLNLFGSTVIPDVEADDDSIIQNAIDWIEN
jgi:hypothetical protein